MLLTALMACHVAGDTAKDLSVGEGETHEPSDSGTGVEDTVPEPPKIGGAGPDLVRIVEIGDLPHTRWSSLAGEGDFADAFATLERPGGELVLAAGLNRGDSRFGDVVLLPVDGADHTTADALGWIYGTVPGCFMQIAGGSPSATATGALRDWDGDGGDELFLGLSDVAGIADLGHDAMVGSVIPTPSDGETWYGDGFGVVASKESTFRLGMRASVDRGGTGIPSAALGLTYGDAGVEEGSLLLFDASVELEHPEDADQIISCGAGRNDFGPTEVADLDGDGYEDFVVSRNAGDDAPYDDGWVSVLYGPIADRTSLDEAEVNIVPEADGQIMLARLVTEADRASAGFAIYARSCYDCEPTMSLVWDREPGTYDLSTAASAFETGFSTDDLWQADLDGDGNSDMIEFNRSVDNAPDAGGCLTIVWGPLSTANAAGPKWLCNSNVESASPAIGEVVDASLDVDGDGRTDLFIGSNEPGTEKGQDGAVYLLTGATLETLKP